MTRRILVAALVALQCLSAASLPAGIDRLLATNLVARKAFWGIRIVDLATGKTLYDHNPDRYFVPASNTKLFTTALALMRLGPDFTFQTRVLADSPPDDQGIVRGSLRLVGGGDPNLSARAIPYKPGPQTGDPLGPLDELAAQVAARGVKRVSGDIVGDDSWYVWRPYPNGWSIDDPNSLDGAPVSALTVHDNAQRISIAPGAREGDLALIAPAPALEYYRLDNRVRTAAPGAVRRIRLERLPGSLDARLSGSIPLHDRGTEISVAIDDPARYAAMAFRRALELRGITVDGGAVPYHVYADEASDSAPAAAPANQTELARRVSAPLIEDLRITDKVSQNLHAELALRAVARARRNVGTVDAAMEEMQAFLSEAAIEPDDYNFHDGSGLARNNLVTPSAIVKLLRHMYASPVRDAWISLLPVGGRDGTISTRFADSPAAGRVHAKTGSLAHVSALSGYVQRPSGDWVAFSIIANNYNSPSADIRAVIDRICNLILE